MTGLAVSPRRTGRPSTPPRGQEVTRAVIASALGPSEEICQGKEENKPRLMTTYSSRHVSSHAKKAPRRGRTGDLA